MVKDRKKSRGCGGRPPTTQFQFSKFFSKFGRVFKNGGREGK
jgi:hypothetical protein